MTTKTNEIEVQDAEKQEVEVLDGVERTRSGKVFIPRAEIYETHDALAIVTDMPGVDEDSVDITLEKNVLTLRGFVDMAAPDNYSLVYAEYEAGDYERSFTLSDEIDRDNIEASLKNGVLTVWLPKAGPAKTRKISVKAA